MLLPHLKPLTKPAPRALSIGVLPSQVDPRQPPTKKQPFAAIRAQQWISALDMLLPVEVAEMVLRELNAMMPRYGKVIMKLGEVLEGDMFNEGIKKGNIMMMTEGRRDVDNRFELFDGTLRLELDKATYERAGLIGKPIRDGGLKHKNNRFAVEIDLRQSSMLHGKKGFERIKWACKNVLDQSLTWVFYDRTTDPQIKASEALEKYHPRWIESQVQQTALSRVKLPYFTAPFQATTLEAEDTADVEEWLSLVMHGSQRVLADDASDPFICRYEVPRRLNDAGEATTDELAGDLTLLRWQGFFPWTFVLEVLLKLKRDVGKESWWAIRSRGLRHGHDTLTVLSPAGRGDDGRGYICWHSPN